MPTSHRPITRFEGDYFFLSNFYEGTFRWRGRDYPTAEHAFQAAKGYFLINADKKNDYMTSVASAATAAQAKRMGKQCKVNLVEWETHKVDYMREIVYAKFEQVQTLAGKLVNTGAGMLVEGDDWGDKFWGRVDGEGLNVLGSILMEIRGKYLYSIYTPVPF